jgi:hypothetical protein
MKKSTILLCLLVSSFIAQSQTTMPCPTSFKRSNGAGGGCPIAKLTLTYAECPSIALPIDSVYQSGVKINATFDAGVIDCSGAQFQVTYCITSSNIAPTGFLTIYFHAAGAFDGNTCTVPDGGPLPVEMSAFYAKRTKSNVVLNWQTESELNTREFIVQRKTGNEFVDIATVSAANRATGSNYSFTDINTSRTTSQYRLKIVDLDARFSNSETRSVKGLDANSDFSIYPNPSTGNAKVTITDISEPTDVQVIDNAGRIIRTVPMNNANSVSIDNLQKGMYMIRLVTKSTGESNTKKLTVIN